MYNRILTKFEKIQPLLFGLFFVVLFFFAPGALARQNVTEWYIQDFDSKIIVNKDSSLDVTERITADCGMAIGKHGIFRILPEKINLTTGETVKTPVELLSITDFAGNKIEYSQSKNNSDGTVTWKIGDPNRTVTGVNYYEIHYRVKNAVRFQDGFDEFYWNLNGNFWDLETDHFHARIIFPEEVTQEKSTVDYYTGFLGSKEKSLATYHWSASNVLEFESTRTLRVREGITVSVVFPKNVFMQYIPGFWETYGQFFFLLIPIAVFFACFYFWWKFGRDPKVKKTVIAEYGVPGDLSPIELGMLMKSGSFSNNLITAEIINFATKGLITIKETHQKIIFFDSKDYEMSKLEKPEEEKLLNKAQKRILKGIFKGLSGTALSKLKNSFYKEIPDIKKFGEEILKEKKLIASTGMTAGIFMGIAAFLGFFIAFSTFNFSLMLAASFFLSSIILLFFAFLMPRRTQEGAELNWKIKGFKLFMETVDKDRAEFYEKENIFEKFLPYAIVFGMTEIWIKRMKEIYGEEYFASHVPAWYVGTNLSSSSFESFSSAMDSLSSSIASSTSSPSGSGGGGGAGGGGGGGGGGGW